MTFADYMALLEPLDESEKKMLEGTVRELVFMEQQMAEYKKLPFISVHPKNPALQKSTVAARLYKETSAGYMNAVRVLLSALHKVDEDAENELLEQLKEFTK